MSADPFDEHTRLWAADWHPEGIYRCNGCGRTYPEYVNGCVEDHDPPRKVQLAIPDEEPSGTWGTVQ